MATFDTGRSARETQRMAQRQTRNVSLPPAQDAFVEAMVASGRYQTVSEVFRDGLRLLEDQEHRRLIERWLRGDLSDAEFESLPDATAKCVMKRFDDLLEPARRQVARGEVRDAFEVIDELRRRYKGEAD